MINKIKEFLLRFKRKAIALAQGRKVIKLEIPDTDKYWEAVICATNSHMYKEATELRGGELEHDFAAITCPFDKYDYSTGEGVLDPCMGKVFFSRECLGGGLVSHELLHVALSCERRIHGNENAVMGPEVTDEEERVAYLLTYLVDQFIEKAYD